MCFCECKRQSIERSTCVEFGPLALESRSACIIDAHSAKKQMTVIHTNCDVASSESESHESASAPACSLSYVHHDMFDSHQGHSNERLLDGMQTLSETFI